MNMPELETEYAALKAMLERINRRVGQKCRYAHAEIKRRVEIAQRDHIVWSDYYRSLCGSAMDMRYIMPDTLNAKTAAMIRRTFRYE